ncbi:MAG: ATP-binding cassette domain-containing protein [Cyanobacteria bacterium]|nr:ATP-binding cassette domain-containing protein [Cyanobacteriota bacterium]
MTPANSGCQLETQGLSKRFGAKQVLHAVDLVLDPGQFVAIVGRSGCGKSTLLRLLSGLDPASSGRVLINEQPLRGLNHQARIMFQDGRLLPWKTVLENVGLGVRGNWRLHAHELLQQVGLQDRPDDWISQLSGGQRQRVALAKALITRPRLMLLDEPLGALDALTRIEMQVLIENLWSEQRFTAALVTHDVEEAVTLADRILVLEEGRIARDFPNPLPRPRRRDHPGFSRLSGEILNVILERQPAPALQVSAAAAGATALATGQHPRWGRTNPAADVGIQAASS